MANVSQVLDAIVDGVYDRVVGEDLSLEELNLAAVVLLNVKENLKIEADIFAGR